MTLEELKQFAEKGYITDVTLISYYSEHEDELESLSGTDIVNLGYVTQVGFAQKIMKEHPDQVTLTINPTPAEATVKINEEEKTSIEVEYGTEVSYEVSYDGYETKSGTEKVTATKTLDVVLDKKEYTFELTTTPEDAEIEITINEDPQKFSREDMPVKVKHGDTAHYKVTATGYDEKSADESNITENKNISVELTKQKFNFTVNVQNEDITDPKITINGEDNGSAGKTLSKEVEYGSTVTWKVEKEGYTTQEGTEESVTSETTKDITLVTASLPAAEPVVMKAKRTSK